MARFARTETERPDISVAVASFDQQTSSAGGGLILLVQAQGGGLILLVQSTRVRIDGALERRFEGMTSRDHALGT